MHMSFCGRVEMEVILRFLVFHIVASKCWGWSKHQALTQNTSNCSGVIGTITIKYTSTLKQVKICFLFCFYIGILDFCHSHSYAEMLSVEQKGAETVAISLKSEELQLHSPQAPQITHVVRLFLIELTKVLIPHPSFQITEWWCSG